MQTIPTMFHFKRERIKNADGVVIGEGNKHPSVEINLPAVTQEDLIKILQDGGVVQAFVLELLNGAISDQAREQITEFRKANTEAVVTPDVLDFTKLSLEAIATMPKAERGGSGLSDDDIAAFCENYQAVMPTALNKEPARIAKHVDIFKNRIAKAKGDKQVVGILHDALQIWLTSSPQAEEFVEVYNYFDQRCAKLLQAPDRILAESL